MKSEDLIVHGMIGIAAWEAQFPTFDVDPLLRVDETKAQAVLDMLADRLQNNFPFFHPLYAGQMLKPPHPVAAAAYAMTQRINPNNHAFDGGPATSEMEIEVVAQLQQMFNLPDSGLGHLTGSGTIANLEALWVSRQSHPGKKIAVCSEAHYTHQRMCSLLGVEVELVAADRHGRMDPDSLEAALRGGEIGTVVVTAGTTSIGAVDPIDQIRLLATDYGARVHVDAAYGGFFVLLSEVIGALPPEVASAFRAIAHCDSVVVDPHKHGLQPYGCGAVLFADRRVGRFYQHDSPYTYFIDADLHLGEISLECSRAGAAAAALWATLQCFPLRPDAGFGPIMSRTRAAAIRWAEMLEAEAGWSLLLPPSLDILCFFPQGQEDSVAAISATSRQKFDALMAEGVFLALLQVDPGIGNTTSLTWDQPKLTVFRSVLMKPEHFEGVPELHRRLTGSGS